MKKLTYLLAGAAVLAACQSQPTSFQVTGSLDGEPLENTNAILVKYKGRTPLFLDTVKVENNQFVFNGVADTADFANIYFFKEGAERPFKATDFVLENGNIQIKLTEQGDILSGTTNNELVSSLNAKRDSLNNLIKEAFAAIDTSAAANIKEQQIDQAQKTYKELAGKINDVYKTFIQENIGNMVGYNYFKQVGTSVFSFEEQEELVGKVPAQYADSDFIKYLKESIEAEKKTAVGQKFIDFTMKTPQGKDLKLSDIVAKNKVTLIDFWASWCGPCRGEMPNVVKDYKTFKSKGLEIVGVSLDNNDKQWKDAIKELKITWPQMSDLKGWQCEGAKLYNVRGIPATVLIGQDGTILAKGLRGEDLTNKLAELLK